MTLIISSSDEGMRKDATAAASSKSIYEIPDGKRSDDQKLALRGPVIPRGPQYEDDNEGENLMNAHEAPLKALNENQHLGYFKGIHKLI